jgi:hypothetical protein
LLVLVDAEALATGDKDCFCKLLDSGRFTNCFGVFMLDLNVIRFGALSLKLLNGLHCIRQLREPVKA